MRTAITWSAATAFYLPEFDTEDLELQLRKRSFNPCGKTQLESIGWVSPTLNSEDDLVYVSSAGVILLMVRHEEKILPTSVISEHMAARIEKLEATLQRKIRGKEKLDIRDNVVAELAAQAFSKSSYEKILLLPNHKLLIVSSSTGSKVDRCTTLLRECVGSLPIQPVQTETAANALFRRWLIGSRKTPKELSLGARCTLQNEDDVKGIVDVKQQDLVSDEWQPIYAGREVIKMALLWGDSLRFTLNEELVMTGIKFSGLNNIDDTQEDLDADGLFDASVALVGLELGQVVNGLINIFGGLKEK